ncbi:MAG: InlB B-repeat-containing protein [Lachnospiraceae bacterium]|nr:InlB B-repeat-containing protein [Lachnospiraceae bacterium]
MGNIVRTLLAVILAGILLPHVVLPVQAAEEKFQFELSVDGKDTKEVEPGDVITVVLRLKRTDAGEAYTMYAMQDEIRYDSTFLELVEGSAMLGNGIASTDIAMVDRYREFYMNYLSMGGGEKWNADTLIGSFQLKVTGDSGVTKITSEDYLVSYKDGSGSYPCEANELTIILTTDCVVTFRTNGGSELEDITVQFGEKIPLPEEPEREGYELEGWYTDIHLTEEWDFDEDTVEGNMSLYAKWVEATESYIEQTSDGIQGNWLWWIIILLIILGAFLLRNYKKYYWTKGE